MTQHKLSNRHKTYFLKIRLDPAQRALIEQVWGPKKYVSANIRAALLRPNARCNPDQHHAVVQSLNAIEALLESILMALQNERPTEISDFIRACAEAHGLMEEARRHAT